MTGATVIVRHLSRIRDPKVVSTATSSTFGRMTRLPYHRTLISLTHTRWWEELLKHQQKPTKTKKDLRWELLQESSMHIMNSSKMYANGGKLK